MIDDKGVLKLIDMGTAKQLEKKPHRTFTIIGTPHYMAPEVLQNKGYSFSVDLWSLGVMLFEFMCGFCPFGEEQEDPFDIYQEIIKSHLQIPSYMKDKKAASMMKRLLNKNQDKRLSGSFANLKAHKWFRNFDFDDLAKGKTKPTYVPKTDTFPSKDAIEKAYNQKKRAVEEAKKDKSKDEYKSEIGKSKIKDWDAEF